MRVPIRAVFRGISAGAEGSSGHQSVMHVNFSAAVMN